MKRVIQASSFADMYDMTDDEIREYISTKVLKMEDKALETALRRILFDSRNEINWKNAFEDICYQMPEVTSELRQYVDPIKARFYEALEDAFVDQINEIQADYNTWREDVLTNGFDTACRGYQGTLVHFLSDNRNLYFRNAVLRALPDNPKRAIFLLASLDPESIAAIVTGRN